MSPLTTLYLRLGLEAIVPSWNIRRRKRGRVSKNAYQRLAVSAGEHMAAAHGNRVGGGESKHGKQNSKSCATLPVEGRPFFLKWKLERPKKLERER